MRFRGSGFAIEPETQFAAKQRGWKVVEVPIHVHYETAAQTQPRLPRLRSGGQHPAPDRAAPTAAVLRRAGPRCFCWRAWRWGSRWCEIYEATTTLAVGYALITVLLVIVGTLAVFVGIMLHALSRDDSRRCETRQLTKLLVVASSLDLTAPLSSTPSWWQLLKALAERGVEPGRGAVSGPGDRVAVVERGRQSVPGRG